MIKILFQSITDRKKRLLLSFLSLTLFYLLCNGYSLFHQAFAGDALLMIHQNDAAWQIALGRFFQPILILLRGGIETPFLISVLAIFWLSLSVYYFCDIFSLDQPFHYLLIAALFGCNLSLIVANASFLPWTDFYALALFLAIFGVRLWNDTGTLKHLLGILLIALSLGIYQSYVCVAIGILILYYIRTFSESDDLRPVLRKALYTALCLAFSFLLYYLIWKLFQRVFHIWTSDSYNGLSSVGDYSGQSLAALFISTYRRVWDALWNPEIYITMSFREVSLSLLLLWGLRLLNLTALLLLLFVFLSGMKKTHARQRVICTVLLLLFPFGINLVCFLSKDMEHSLMIFAFCLIFAAIPVLSRPLNTPPVRNASSALPFGSVLFHGILTVIICAGVWSNIIFANQLYLKRELQEEAAHSLMTRIVYEIEHTPGYEPGITPVAFSGSFETTPYTDNPTVFSDLHPWGVGRTSMTYGGTDYAYLTYVLNVHMNLVRVDATEVCDLPVYPAPGSVAFVGDTLVVKISEL